MCENTQEVNKWEAAFESWWNEIEGFAFRSERFDCNKKEAKDIFMAGMNMAAYLESDYLLSEEDEEELMSQAQEIIRPLNLTDFEYEADD